MIKKIIITLLFFVSSVGLSSLFFTVRAENKAPRTLMVLGDSLSAAYGIPVEKGWVSLLQTRLGEQAKVINISISGETTQGGKVRLAKALDQHSPDIMLLELGGNDGLRGIEAKVMYQNLSSMIEMAQKREIKVVLLGIKIPPNYGKAYTDTFEKVFTDLVEKYQLSFIPFILKGIADDYDLMQFDGIHPNIKAQNRLLENIMPAVKEVLGEK